MLPMQRNAFFKHLRFKMYARSISSLFFLFLLAASLRSPAQEAERDDMPATDAVNTESVTPPVAEEKAYAAVDAYVLAMKGHYKKIPDLAKDLAAPYTTDEDKVRAIFMWVTNNIAYDCALFHSNNNKGLQISYKDQAELDAKREKYYSDYATRVLRGRKAICEGYAVLFQELCRQNGIRCEIVIGRVSNNTAMIARVRNRKNFSTNHAWDKVMINGTWYYVDPTWASGYCDKKVKKFYKDFKGYYYLTSLDQLYATHAANEKQTEKRNNAVARSR